MAPKNLANVGISPNSLQGSSVGLRSSCASSYFVKFQYYEQKFHITYRGKFVEWESGNILLERSDSKKLFPDAGTLIEVEISAKHKKFGIFRLESMTTPRRKVLRHTFLAENVSGTICYNLALGCLNKFRLSAEKSRLAQIGGRLAQPNLARKGRSIQKTYDNKLKNVPILNLKLTDEFQETRSEKL